MAAAIRRGRWSEAPALTERQRALCTLAEKLSGDPVSVCRDDWDAVRAAGLDDEGCLELAHVVGVFNHLTRLADGLGIELDPRVAEAAAGGPKLSRASSAVGVRQ